MARTRADHERVVDLVEDQMLIGIDRPGPIVRAVNKRLAEEDAAHLAIGDKRTAQKMMQDVRDRWKRRDGDTEALRQRLIAEAEEAGRQAYGLFALARNQSNLAAAVGALRNVKDFQQRRARLLGLDNIKVAIAGDPEGAPIRIATRLDELDTEQLRKLADEPGATPSET